MPVTAYKGVCTIIRKNTRRLEGQLGNSKLPAQWRKGIEAQLRRAEEYHKQGRLKGVEVTEGANRYDLVLESDEVVEVKLWRQEYTSEHKAQLLRQLKKYEGSGKTVNIDFVRTKTDPLTKADLDELWQYLKDNGVSIDRNNINLVD